MTDTADREPTLAELQGLWTRSLIQWPDGRRDVTTQVHWLQGPSLYIDLRQPTGRPDFGGARTPADLDETQIAWLATQEGFAGRLRHVDGWFEWHRSIDFQPAGPYADAGSLRHATECMIEVGRDVPYVEHWHRADVGDGSRSVAVRLVDEERGRAAALVRVGEVFMFALDRQTALPPLPDLAHCVAAAADRAARLALVDCELAVGRLDGERWRLTRSSLPWREGTILAPRAVAAGLLTLDDGTNHHYSIAELEGDATLLGL